MSDAILIQPTLLQVPVNSLANRTLDLLSTYGGKSGMSGLTRDEVIPPVAMLSIARQILDDGYGVSIVDMYLEEVCGEDAQKVLIMNLKKENPKVVGIAGMECCILDAAIDIAKIVKKINKDTVVSIGGVNATAMDEYILSKYSMIDVVVRGEAEKIFSDLVAAIVKNKPLSTVKGISYKLGTKIKRNALGPFLKPEDIPLPAREIYPFKRLYKINKNTDMIFASRGCPHNCAFCNAPSFWKRIWRGRLIKDVIEEMKIISDNGAERFYLWDLNFGTNKKWAIDICKSMKKENLELIWEVELRVDNLSKSFVKEITSAGCTTAFCGIESNEQNVLDSVNKSYNHNLQETALKTSKKYKLNIEGGYIIGLPNDNKITISSTTNLAIKLFENELAIPLFFIFVPFPGTDIGDNPGKYGIKIENHDFQNYHFIPKVPLASTRYLTAKEVFDLWEDGQRHIFNSVKKKLSDLKSV